MPVVLERTLEALKTRDSPERRLNQALSTVSRQWPFAQAALYLRPPGQDELRLSLCPDHNLKEQRHLLPAPEQLPQLGARDRPRLFQWGPRNYWVAPVAYEGELMAMIALSRVQNQERPQEEEACFVELLGQLLVPTISRRQASLPNSSLDSPSSSQILGRSKAMLNLSQGIETVAASDTTVLIRGESGVGKELVANAIHQLSHRRNKPLIKVNCAALPDSILESELFGHEQGAFTGALQRRIGRFEQAHQGTIFLDEIGDFPASTQITLLRILQEQTFQRVGSNQDVKSDVRIIAATNRNLEEMMNDNSFRHDLYYRLNVFPILVPALKERRTDIPLLADFFVEKFSRANNKRVRRISSQAIDMLMAYHWPGNVRELENCIERAVLLAEEHVIQGRHLPPTLQTAEATETNSQGSLESLLQGVERDLLDDALKAARGNIAQAARNLGLSERKMGLRIKKYQLNPRRYKVL